MKKLLSLLGFFALAGTSTTAVIACGNMLTEADLPSASKLDEISTVIKNRNLGSFNQSPTDQQILDVVKEKNPQLKLEEVQVINNGHGEATIKVNEESKVYVPQEVIVYYTDPDNELIKLSSVIQTTDLGKLTNKPTEVELLAKVVELNPGLDTSQVIVSEYNGRTQATIKVIDGSIIYYSGAVNVSFEIDSRADLSSVITDKKLPDFPTTPTEAEVLAEINLKNPLLKVSEVFVTLDIPKRTAILMPHSDSDIYKGEVEFPIVIKLPSFLDKITTTDLGIFAQQPTIAELRDKIAQLNPNLDMSQIVVNAGIDGKATVTPIPGSVIYDPEIKQEFSFVVDGRKILSDLFKDAKNRLGEFSTPPTEDQIKQAIQQIVADFQFDKVSLNLNNGIVTVTSNEGNDAYQGSVQLFYKVNGQASLDSVIVRKFLGNFFTTPSVDQVKERINAANPMVDFSQFDIKVLDNNNAELTVKPTSLVYFPNEVVKLEFTVKDTRIELTQDLTITNLEGIAGDLTVEHVKTLLEHLNPNLKLDEVVITINGQSATVAAKDGSTVYKPGSVQLDYRPSERKNLSDVLTNLNLGSFATMPSEADVRAALTTANPGFVSDKDNITVTFVGGVDVVIDSTTTSPLYKPGSVKVTFSLTNKVSLASVITDTHLGEFTSPTPTEGEILTALKADNKNPNLDITQVHVVKDSIANNMAQIDTNPDSSVYETGALDLSFNYSSLDSIGGIFNGDFDLGVFDHQPTKEEIINAIKAKFPTIDDSQLTFDVSIPNQVTVAVIEHSIVYQPGSITLTYSVVEKEQISRIIIDNNFVVYSDTSNITESQILTTLKVLYPSLDIRELRGVVNLNDETVQVSVNPGSLIYAQGSLTLTYHLSARADIASVFNTSVLGEFANYPNSNDLMDRIKSLNPDVDLNQIQIDANGDNDLVLRDNHIAIARVKDNSTSYNRSSVYLSFTVHEMINLTDVIKITNLPTFANDPTDTVVLTKLKELNPELDISQVYLSNNHNNEATVKVREDATRYRPATINLTYSVTTRTRNSVFEFFTQKLLGLISSSNPDVILAEVVIFNPLLLIHQSELEVVHISRGQATVRVKDGATFFAPGSVEVNFLLPNLPPLSRDLVNTSLGRIDTANGGIDENAIWARIRELNPYLDTTQVHFSSLSATSVKIVPNLGSSYWPMLPLLAPTVNYSLGQLVKLNTVLTSLEIAGSFNNHLSADDILSELGKTNPRLVTSELIVSANDEFGKATVTVKPKSSYYLPDSIQVTYRQVNNISSALTELDLGMFNTTPTNDMILERIGQKNPTLKITDFEVVGLSRTDHYAIIQYKQPSQIGTGDQVVVYYRVSQQVQLADVLKTTMLGLYTKNDPTPVDFATDLEKVNPNFISNEVNITRLNNTQALVEPKTRSIYQGGGIVINFKVELSLATEIKNIDLGYLETPINTVPSEQALLAALKAQNPNVDISQLSVKFNAPNSSVRGQQATILVKPTSDLYALSQVLVVNYITPKDLTSDLKVTSLGRHPLINSESGVLAALLVLNQDLQTSELTVSDISGILNSRSAIVHVRGGSHYYYSSQITVTWTRA